MNNIEMLGATLIVISIIGFIAGTIEKKLANLKTKNFYNYKMMVNGKMRTVPIVKLTRSPFDGRWAISYPEAQRINKMYEGL